MTRCRHARWSKGGLREPGSPLPWAASRTARTAARNEGLPVPLVTNEKRKRRQAGGLVLAEATKVPQPDLRN